MRIVRTECLNQFVISGERHLRHLLREYLAHYVRERLQQGLDGRSTVPIDGAEDDNSATGAIRCRSRFGGLLNFYHREAA